MGNLLAPAPFDFGAIFKSVITRWYLYVALVVVIMAVVIFVCIKKPPKRNSLSSTQKIAYISILTALSVAVNILQIPFPLVQLSFVATIAFLAGVLLGPIEGFTVAIVGDLIAGIIMPVGVYSPIIAIGTSLFGFIPGVVFAYFKGKVWIKAIISYLLTFVLSSALINTIGLCMIYTSIVLVEKLALLPLNFAFHAVNCVISILLLIAIKRIFPRNKFYIDKYVN